jgi:hypothetical protein
MALTFDRTVGTGATETLDLDLPVPGTFSEQSQTWIAVLAIRRNPALPVVNPTYVVRDDASNAVTVPSTPGSLTPGPNFSVTLVSRDNGLSIIRIDHGVPLGAFDTVVWQLDIGLGGGDPETDFRVVVAHSEAAARLPRMFLIIGTAYNPAPATLDFGRATFNATKTLSVIVFNTGTGDLTLGTLALTDATGFYDISDDPSGAVLSPNDQVAIDVDYSPSPPPPVAPHNATLAIPSATAGVASQNVAVTGSAVFREIVLCIDASNSMNWTNAGTPLSGCPVATTLAPNYDPDSRMRQVRAALGSFHTKLTEYGEGQTLLGIVQFPGGHLVCGSSHNTALGSPATSWATTVQGLTPFTAADPTHATNLELATQFGYYHSTPMHAGLERSLNLFTSDPGKFRVIVLLSDGKHNVPQNIQPEALLPVLTSVTRPIRVLAIGFGETESVDHPKLESLAVQTKLASDEERASWTGFFAYNPDAEGNTEQLESFYTKLFTDIFELDQAVDPTAQIAWGATQQHKVPVTEFDQRVTFSIAWTTPRRELLDLTLIAPDGQRITPNSQIGRYYSGEKHKLYAIDVQELGDDFIGEWTMEVRYGPPREPEGLVIRAASVAAVVPVETYSYETVMRSGLSLRVRFDRTRYHTGDRVVVRAELTETGRPLLGQSVTVQVKRPDQGIGNWYADHPVGLETIESALAEQFGPGSAASIEQIPPVFMKQYYLTHIGQVTVPGYHPAFSSPVAMRDDGQGSDVQAHDGIYTAAFDDLTARPGIFSFTVVASGTTRGGHPFRREQVVHLTVHTRVDTTLNFTFILIDHIGGRTGGLFGIGGKRTFRAYIRPQDHLGNFLGPGYGREISIESSGARAVTPVVDDLSGGYYRVFEYDDGLTGRPTVEFEVGGEALPPQALEPGRLGMRSCLLLLIPALLLALLIILILVLRGA